MGEISDLVSHFCFLLVVVIRRYYNGGQISGLVSLMLKDKFTFWNMLDVPPVFRVEHVTCSSSYSLSSSTPLPSDSGQASSLGARYHCLNKM